MLARECGLDQSQSVAGSADPVGEHCLVVMQDGRALGRLIGPEKCPYILQWDACLLGLQDRRDPVVVCPSVDALSRARTGGAQQAH